MRMQNLESVTNLADRELINNLWCMKIKHQHLLSYVMNRSARRAEGIFELQESNQTHVPINEFLNAYKMTAAY